MKKRMLAVALSASMVVSMGVVTLPVHAEEGEPYKAALLLTLCRYVQHNHRVFWKGWQH